MKFDCYHPVINFIYFTTVVACTLCFDQPVFLLISFLGAFLYSVKLGGMKRCLLNFGLLLLAFGYAGWYASYNHFGMTNIGFNYIENRVTLESIVYGMVVGIKVITVVMWFGCVFQLITADKIVYLFGRISPKLSLFLSILLRTVPRVVAKAKGIERSREGIGRGVVQGNFGQRIRNCISLLSIVITWTLEDFIESANSMKGRGYSLRGRTAFSIYRFDNRDRCLVIAFAWCLVIIGMAVAFDQTVMYFDPVIILNPITEMSFVFYAVYGIFLFLPLLLQMIGEYRFLCYNKSSIKSGGEQNV